MKYVFRKTKYILFIVICLLSFTIKGYALPKSEIIYKLFTDDLGVKWQYAYNDDTTASSDAATETWVEISFFEKPESMINITVPSLDKIKNVDSTIPNSVKTLKLINYEDENLGTPSTITTNITEISVENVDEIDGISPMISENVETKVIFSNSGKSIIGKNAFKGYKLNLVNLDKIAEIGNEAFKNSTLKNKNVNFSSLKKIGDGAFWNTNLEQVEINVENIHYNAFRDCTDLKTVILGDSVTKINDAAFYGDSSLDSINFNNVTYVGNFAFRDCTSFNVDISNTKFEYIGDAAFYYTTGYTRNIKIPDGVTSIGWRTFYKSGIASLNLNKVKNVGVEAFLECPNLSSINFGDTEVIEYRAFAKDSLLTNIEFSDSVYDIHAEAFEECSIENLNLNKVQRIRNAAFRNNNLTEIYLPKSISVIEESQIFDRNPITKVTVAYDTMIGYPANRVSASGNLFKTILGDNTYKNVTDLELIAPYSLNEEIVIDSKFGTTHIDDPFISVSYGRGDANLGKENTYKNVIKSNYFYDMSGLVNVKIGEGYEFIGSQAFMVTYGSNFEKIDLPSTLKGIGSMSFAYSFENDVEIKLPENLDYIGYQAFFKSPGFKEDFDLENIRIIGSKAFESSGVKNVYLHDKLEYLGSQAFFDAMNTKEIIVDVDIYSLPNRGDEYGSMGGPEHEQNNFFRHWDNHQKYDLIKFTDKVVTEPATSLKNGGYSTESFMYSLQSKEVDLSDTPWKTLSRNMFLRANIDELKLPSNLEYIGTSAFYETTINNELQLPNTIITIDDNAFQNINFKINQIPSNVEKIGNAAFYNSDFNSNPIVPNSVKLIGTSAFGAPTNSEIVRETFTFDCDLPGNIVAGGMTGYYSSVNAITYNTTINKLILTENVKHLPTNTLSGYSEFYDMDMEEVIIDGVEIIPSKAFQDNKNLKLVDLSKDTNLKEIKDHSFYNDEELEKIKFTNDTEQTIKVGYSAFRNNGYKSIGVTDKDGFNLLAANFILEDNDLTDTFVFADNNKLEEVTIPNGFNNNYIPAFTFTRSANLEKVTVGEEVEKIGKYAFAEDVNLEKILLWGNTEIERINEEVEINKPNNIIVKDNTDGIAYDFVINKDGEEVASMNVSPMARAVNTISYDYDGNGEITFEYPDTVIINSEETTDGYEVTVSSIDPANFTIPSTTDIYAYNKTDATEYEQYYNRYRQSEELDTDSDILFFDEVIYLTSNNPVVSVTDNKDNFDKSNLTVYALRRDGIIMESSTWGKYGTKYKLSELPYNIVFNAYNENTTDKTQVVYLAPFSADKADSSTENFANMTFDIVQSNDSNVKYIDLFYTNSFIDTEVTTPINPKRNIQNVETLDNIAKYVVIAIVCIILIIVSIVVYKINKKKTKDSK